VSSPGSLERVILVPRNGLGNRLQAWSSAALLARTWGVPLDVMWEPEPAAPAPASDLFASDPGFDAVDHAFLDRESLDRLLGSDHEDMPRYLHEMPERRVVCLAGHDRGEQAFMDDLLHTLHGDDRLKTLVIIAGGLFTLDPHNQTAFRQGRREFYGSLPWHPAITERVHAALPDTHYSALHIRQTDRSREAPTPRVIERALQQMMDSGADPSLFIAADTAQSRATWNQRSKAHGFTPWSVADTEFTRSARAGGMSAAVDWVLLSRSSFLAYPGASTFSAEACVANGGSGIALYASELTQRARAAREVIRNGLSYPKRHGWGLPQR
jgi:hypothetical protein